MQHMQEHDLKSEFFATWRNTVLINRNQDSQMHQHPAVGHTCCIKIHATWRTTVRMHVTWRTTVLINRNQYQVAWPGSKVHGTFEDSQMQQHPAVGHTCCFRMLMEVLGYHFSDYSPLARFGDYSPLARFSEYSPLALDEDQ